MSALFLIGVVVQYFGYSLAVMLADSTPMWLIGSARAFFSGLIFLAVGLVLARRSARMSREGLLLGIVASVMNIASFGAAGTLPLGVATALEFVGPIALAAVAARSARSAIMVMSGLAGVVVLYLRVGVPQFADTAGLGLLLALASAALWATYIRLGHSTESVQERLVGFGIGLALGGVSTGLIASGVGDASPWTTMTLSTWGQLVGIAVLASVVPYVIDLLCLKVMSPHTFAILTVTLPAVAALLGWLILGQTLGWWGLLGLCLVVVSLLLLRTGDGATSRQGSER
ncbi:EamA family transporter [Gordonia alkaliphila]|uniref:EamA family transporter n=2 Tax=Gordonia alkaliphila TaxID=1053547 RepID=A0ABP8YZX3_9ACTN